MLGYLVSNGRASGEIVVCGGCMPNVSGRYSIDLLPEDMFCLYCDKLAESIKP